MSISSISTIGTVRRYVPHLTSEPINPWKDGALCAQVDPELFFPSRGEQNTYTETKKLCKKCDVKEECLLYILAIENGKEIHERHGMWAGLTPGQRYRLQNPSQE